MPQDALMFPHLTVAQNVRFGATILVADNIPGRTQTLSLAIFSRVELGHDAEAYRLVAVTVAVAFAAMIATEWIASRRTARLRA